MLKKGSECRGLWAGRARLGRVSKFPTEEYMITRVRCQIRVLVLTDLLCDPQLFIDSQLCFLI